MKCTCYICGTELPARNDRRFCKILKNITIKRQDGYYSKEGKNGLEKDYSNPFIYQADTQITESSYCLCAQCVKVLDGQLKLMATRKAPIESYFTEKIAETVEKKEE